MPRDANGNYTLPAGNPVVTGTTIETAWANPTMDDIKQALTDSLDRYGRGGMQAPFRFVDGTNSAPGISWASELSTGFYRAAASDMRATVAGVPQMRWTGVGVDVWDSVGAAWLPLTTAGGSNFALLNAANVLTGNPQVIVDPAAAWQVWQDTTPTFAARFALDGNFGEIGFYANNIGAWTRVLRFNTTTVEALGGITLSVRNASNALSMQMGHDTNAGYFLTGSGSAAIGFYPENVRTFDIRQAAINVFGEIPLRFNNAAQTAFTALNYNVDSQGSPQLRLTANASPRGAIIHHDDPGYTAGGIVTTTSTPAATGSPGVIWLVVT